MIKKILKFAGIFLSVYGKYLSTSCQGCHKETMKGGEPVAPGYPVVADITSTGHPGKWTDEQFINPFGPGLLRKEKC